MSKEDSRFYLSRKLVYVVTLFIVAASGLVVLTNFAINMIAASGDYTSLLSRWSQYHYQSGLLIERYARSGDIAGYRAYEQVKKQGDNLDQVINELFKPDSDAKLIFDSFSSDNIHPNEISTLIMTFRWFQDYEKVQRIQQTWRSLKQTENQQAELIEAIHRAWETGYSEGTLIQPYIDELNQLNRQWVRQNQELMEGLEEISLVIRHMGLWVSVILGILLVLIGVVITVRANKSIGKWEQTLKERDYLARFPELNPNPVLQIDSEGKINFQNQATKDLFPDLGQKGLDHPFLKHIPSYLLQSGAEANRSYIYEVQVGKAYFQQLIHFISEERGFDIYAQDITENKKQQHKIGASLKEKEILLAEIHHRVKNNLAVISGLLELESMRSRNPEHALQESRGRIKTMAMIHEVLYQSNSFSEVNLSQYMHQLTDYIGSTYVGQRDHITFQTKFDSVKLSMNQAVPLGLILNEVLANAIEHGFGKANEGEIHIKLEDLGKEVSLVVQDNGKGLSEEFDFESSESVGFTIIKALVKQLKAKVKIKNKNGVGFRLKFPKSDASGSVNVHM